MVCNTCGRDIKNEDANFCEYCGSSCRMSNPTIIIEEPKKEAEPIKKEKDISFGNWLGSMALFMIPGVGPLVFFIMLFIWSFKKETPKVKKNWARAMLVFMGIAFVILVVYMASLMNNPMYKDSFEEIYRMYYNMLSNQP